MATTTKKQRAPAPATQKSGTLSVINGTKPKTAPKPAKNPPPIIGVRG